MPAGSVLSLYVQERLITIECCRCGVVFAMTEALQRNFRKTQDAFYCPNGHEQSYTKSLAEELREQLDAAKRDADFQRERAASLDKRLKREQQGAARLKRRVSVGVCPCCQRTVRQLADHMKSKHPEYVAEQQPPQTT